MNRSLFSQSVDVILEDATFFKPATEALQQLQNAKDIVTSAESGLREHVDALNNRLALEIRRHNPALGVTLGRDGNCVVRYKGFGNCIKLTADPQEQRFKCGKTAFERRFRRYHGHTLDLDVGMLGEAVAKFFKQNYRSLK